MKNVSSIPHWCGIAYAVARSCEVTLRSEECSERLNTAISRGVFFFFFFFFYIIPNA
jgi:hypothetical protein